MKVFEIEKCKGFLGRQGSAAYKKTSYPVRYGRYSELEYGNYRYQFNLNGEIKHITGISSDWPHPAEWLKRTIANDWVYYSTGGYYAGVVDLLGEYYLPCPAYQSNSLFKENPFVRSSVKSALKELEHVFSYIYGLSRKKPGIAEDVQRFLTLVGRNTTEHLQRRSEELHRILKARITVLPPDCRHVDYDVIPLMIADGCLYNCSFCEVKSGLDLTCRTRAEIEEQLFALRDFFGSDLPNYNSIYLGQHDALAADDKDILFAVSRAYEIFAIKKSYMKEPKLLLFGSGESMLRKDEQFWVHLNSQPFYTYVNIGLESFDDETLNVLKKPVSSRVMKKAFRRMLAINKRYANIEVTANFLLGDNLPEGHIPSLIRQINTDLKGTGISGKGSIYLSPLKGSSNTNRLLKEFRAIKRKSRLQTFLYLIQRL